MSVRAHVQAVAVAALVVLSSLATPADASVNRTLNVPATRAATPPAFDASLSDPEWKNAVTARSFEDLTTRRPEPLATTAYLLYDAANLYVGFKAQQDGVPIHAEHSTNDVGFGQDDAVGVCIDTSGAGSEVYCFETTPRAVRYEQASESARYAPPWRAIARINGSSWSAMMVIPLKDLRAAGGKDRAWLFNFIRVCAGTGEHYTWAYDGLMSDGQPPAWPNPTDARFWPTLSGLDIATTAARPQPRLEAYGLESSGRDRGVFQQPNNQFAPQPVRHAGVDVTYPLTSTIAAVGTLNPDFSNVEVDQQTIVPQEFQRNLTEYRPFFAQGAQFFTPDQVNPPGGFVTAPDQVFYTPRIGAFDRGMKLEGTYGDQAIGLLEVRGAGTDGSPFDDTAFGFKHALPDRTFAWYANGVLAHHGIGDDSTIDTGLFGRSLASGFVWGYNQALEESRLSFAPAQAFAYARNGFIDVHKPNYEVLEGYQDISPGYGPLDGFTTIDDSRGPSSVFDFAAATPGLKSWTGFFAADRFTTRSGAVHAADFFGNEDVVTNGLIHANVAVDVSELDDLVFTGGKMLPFDQSSLTLGYRDGTPAPVDATYSAGNFGNFLGGQFTTMYLQQFNVAATRPLGARYSLQATYAGTHERSEVVGVDGQLLRSVAVGDSLGPDAQLTLAYRTINGNGGFAAPGRNFAAALHTKFRGGSELFVNFGTPAAQATLDRLIVKYLLRIGGGAGT